MPLDRLIAPELLPILLLGVLAAILLVLIILLVVLVRKPGRVTFDSLAEAARTSRDGIDRLERSLQTQTSALRSESEQRGRALREEVAASVRGFSDSLHGRMADLERTTQERLDSFTTRLGQLLTELSTRTEQRFEVMRTTLAEQLDRLREDNARKLDEMRQTVDEKLQKTLEHRLGESFRLVSDQLNSVYQGLGEMRQVAGDVGDLKRVLSNVKTRGGWAEVQLDAMLEQFLHPEQYVKNVAVRDGSTERVEFAIRLPGKDENERFVLLPVDAKFPKEDYERLCDALERADLDAVQLWGKALEDRLRSEARRIRDKYVCPPATTDFAVMFVPTEGLYAEVARRPALLAELQAELRIMVAGPSTLGALLNSLQMGFRTLALSKRSSEVWDILRATKTEFGRFGEMIEQVRKNIDRAGKSLETVGTRTRGIARALRQVEQLPANAASRLLATPGDDEGVQTAAEDEPGSGP